MIGYCSHNRDPLACPYCAAVDNKRSISSGDYYDNNNYNGTTGPRVIYRDYREPVTPASSIDIQRCEREVARLNEEVRRLGLLVTKLIGIFCPGETPPK